MNPQIYIGKAIVEAALPVGSTEALYVRVDLRGEDPA